MRLSKLVAQRTKEIPNDAKMKNHILLLRAGYIKQVANGIYSLTALGQKACLNIENIIRQEMNALDGQEVKFPVVMPKELWDLSGRYSSIGSEMVRFLDRTGRPMLLGMTHEEAAVHLAKNWVTSYNELPFMIYQIQTKFRDEPRSRGGLIRVREFTMKDAYSFHESQEDLDNYYNKMHKAYENIYSKIGIGKNTISVKSDNGMFGGNMSHEFMYLSEFGEDEIVICENCGYRANQEVAECVYEKNKEEELKPQEEVYTGENHDIDEVAKFLGVPKQKIIKAVVFAVKNERGTVVCFTRGDKEINETKLRKVCKKEVVPYDAKDDKNFVAGNIGPLGLKAKNCEVYYDLSIKDSYNMITGANKKDYHIKNFNVSRDLKEKTFYDLSKVQENDFCPVCHKKVKVRNGIEVGNIFQLGTKYTSSMGMLVKDKAGEEFNAIMGCYGIGIGRNLACVIEENSDDKGICLPFSVAPYKIHIVPIRLDDENVNKISFDLYNKLIENNVEVLIDDRENITAGVKFSEADLIGMPLRIVISPRGLEQNEIELTSRKTKEVRKIKVENCLEEILKILKEEN